MLTIFRQFKGNKLNLSDQPQEYITAVTNTAMALKYINDTGMFTKCELIAAEGAEEFSEHVEDALEVAIRYDLETPFDTVQEKKEKEENVAKEGLCEYVECQTETKQKKKEEFEREFKRHSAIAFLHIFKSLENIEESISSLKHENASLKEALTIIVKVLEEDI